MGGTGQTLLPKAFISILKLSNKPQRIKRTKVNRYLLLISLPSFLKINFIFYNVYLNIEYSYFWGQGNNSIDIETSSRVKSCFNGKAELFQLHGF